MLYAGTLVASGRGKGVVVATGDNTEIGRISAMLSEVETLTTPLMQQIARFGRALTVLVLVLAAFVFGFGVLVYGFSMEDMFLAAVGLAVAAIPEGLPAIVTITLAIGVQRMARRNALVRRLPAVETLGSVSVICTDKTGTLTRNEMMAESIAAGGQLIEVSGEGYAPRGSFLRDATRSMSRKWSRCARCFVARCCAATRCFARAAMNGGRRRPDRGRAGCRRHQGRPRSGPREQAYPRTDVIPFESENRFMATLHHDHRAMVSSTSRVRPNGSSRCANGSVAMAAMSRSMPASGGGGSTKSALGASGCSRWPSSRPARNIASCASKTSHPD